MTCADAGDLAEALARYRGAISDGVMEMSGQQIGTAVADIAAILDGQNIAAADCVAFTCDNDVPSAIVLLALLVCGRTFVLLPPGAQATDISITFCRYHLQVQAPGQPSGHAVPSMPNTKIVVSEHRAWRANLPAGPPLFFIPTSGSTARVKLVQHRQERLLLAAGHCAARLGLEPFDRIALPIPIAHMYGLGAAFVPALLAGACIDIQCRSNALRYLARERQWDPNVAFLTPSFGDALVRLRKAPRHYRLTVMAGDVLNADLFDTYERLHGCLVNLYGSTELGVIAVGNPSDPAPCRRESIGLPMPGVSVWQAGQGEADAAYPAPDLLWFKHDFGFECYVDPAGNSVREPDGSVISSACFRSNDVGQVADRYLTVHGRGDDLVNRDGMLIDCTAIAAALRAIEGIGDAVVLSGAMWRRGRRLIAFCVTDADNGWTAGALRKACLGVLSSRTMPDSFLFMPEFPRLRSGKVDRVALRRDHIPAEATGVKTWRG